MIKKILTLSAILGISALVQAHPSAAETSLESLSINAGAHFDGFQIQKPGQKREKKRSAMDMAAGLAGKNHQKYMAKLQPRLKTAGRAKWIDDTVIPPPETPKRPKHPKNPIDAGKFYALILASGIAALMGGLFLPKKAFADDDGVDTSSGTVTNPHPTGGGDGGGGSAPPVPSTGTPSVPLPLPQRPIPMPIPR